MALVTSTSARFGLGVFEEPQDESCFFFCLGGGEGWGGADGLKVLGNRG